MATTPVTVTMAGRRIGPDAPVFVTFEAGPTHSGLESAKRLVRHAADAGADAVKFQIFDPDMLVADRTQEFRYDILVDRETGKTETISEPLYDILVRRCLTDAEWRELKAYSDELGLAFFATVAFDHEVGFLEELSCDSIKIASADVNHLPLIRHAARTGMCIQLDTGAATLGEIESAVDVIRSEGNERIIIHQCPSGYPARLESINLNIIRTLGEMFPYPVAYSDHTPGWEMDVAAVALGAKLVEKTITEDRTTRSVEHIMSLEPHEMKQFVSLLHDLETAFGVERRILHPEELERRQLVRRSLHLTANAPAGTLLKDCGFEFRRPGNGVGPDQYEAYLEARLARDLSEGHRVTVQDLQW